MGTLGGNDGMFKEGDDAFHLGVATASHNFFLVSAVREARALQRRASVIGLGGHAGAAVEEHEAIFRAIRDGEPEAAAQATYVHLDNTLEDYRRRDPTPRIRLIPRGYGPAPRRAISPAPVPAGG